MAYNRKRLPLMFAFILILALFSVASDWHMSSLNEGGTEYRVPGWVPLNSFWNKFDFHLGLDIKGGTHLEYMADVSKVEVGDRDSAVEGVRDVVERRVNAFGVAEPLVQTNKSQAGEYRLIVELAGVKDVNEAIKMIGETPLLEFKEQNPEYSAQGAALTPEQQKELDDFNAAAKKKAEEINGRALGGEDFASLAKEFSEDPGSKDKGGELGYAKKGMFVPEFDKAIFEDLKVGQITAAPVKTDFGYHVIKKIDERQIEEANDSEATTSADQFANWEVAASHVLIRAKTAADVLPPIDQWKNTNLSGKYLKKAVVSYGGQANDPEVSLEFNSEGAALFEEITGRNVGKPVAIFLDGEAISVPNVNEKITGGKAVITGGFNLVEAKTLVQRLNAGALPVPINLISQQTVGPTLGRVSIEKSLMAGLYGLLGIALFMILFYRLPGLLAVVALIIYIAISLMIFRMIPVTLTVAGIAGFIMSIGMAVDANVLIFERLKEEVKNGRNYSNAVEEGFKRAWTSVRDSNWSTIITCAILYWFGTSVIKGFALTLSIGILISMFSAVVITRNFMRLLPSQKMDKWKWLIGKKR